MPGNTPEGRTDTETVIMKVRKYTEGLAISLTVDTIVRPYVHFFILEFGWNRCFESRLLTSEIPRGIETTRPKCSLLFGDVSTPSPFSCNDPTWITTSLKKASSSLPSEILGPSDGSEMRSDLINFVIN
jgi:hypothetical protein